MQLISKQQYYEMHESSEALSSTTIPNPRESHTVPAQALPMEAEKGNFYQSRNLRYAGPTGPASRNLRE